MGIFPKLFGHDEKLERFFRAVDFLLWANGGTRQGEGRLRLGAGFGT